MHEIISLNLLAVAAGAFLGGVCTERWRARLSARILKVEAADDRSAGPPAPPPSRPFPSRRDAAEQLRIVMGATFRARRLLSRTEARVLYAAERAIADQGLSWRVMGQVSLGEILDSDDVAARAAINSKRVDLLVIRSSGLPIAAIEYQGEGHYQGNAAARDAVKKEALRRAGVRYIEIMPDHGPSDLAHEIARLATTLGGDHGSSRRSGRASPPGEAGAGA